MCASHNVTYIVSPLPQVVLTALAAKSEVARYVLYAQVVSTQRSSGLATSAALVGDGDSSPSVTPAVKPADFSLLQQLLALMTSMEVYSKRYASEFMFALCGEDGKCVLSALHCHITSAMMIKLLFFHVVGS
jgi:hypothetical protein